MKKTNSLNTSLLLCFICLFCCTSLFSANSQKKQSDSPIHITKDVAIEPAFWWSGMEETELQLMVYGEYIADYTVEVNSPQVRLKETVRLDSPNYLILYLDISESEPGAFDILFHNQGITHGYRYELKERNPDRLNIESFNSSDVLYLIMPDRFANGDPSNDQIEMRMPYQVDRSHHSARHGGDLKGISDRLDYLADLGVTAIWLNPVLENDMEGGSYHGYATTNYYNVDPRFGTNEEYVELIANAHAKGMKVVMDMIFNHCGSDHPWMYDVPSADWFNNLDEYVQTSHRKEMYFDPYVSKYDWDKMVDGWFVPHHARLEPAQPPRGEVPDPKQHMVDRVLGGRRHPPGHLPLRRLRYDGALDRGGGKGVPQLQHRGRGVA